MKDYLAEDGGWGAHSPDVEGVFALGKTREEIEVRMAEAWPPTCPICAIQATPDPHTDAGCVAA